MGMSVVAGFISEKTGIYKLGRTIKVFSFSIAVINSSWSDNSETD